MITLLAAFLTTEPITIEESETAAPFYSSISMNEKGEVAALWSYLDEEAMTKKTIKTGILSATRSATGEWSSVTPLETFEGWVLHPFVDMDSDGISKGAWRVNIDDEIHTRFAKKEKEGTWTSLEEIKVAEFSKILAKSNLPLIDFVSSDEDFIDDIRCEEFIQNNSKPPGVCSLIRAPGWLPLTSKLSLEASRQVGERFYEICQRDLSFDYRGLKGISNTKNDLVILWQERELGIASQWNLYAVFSENFRHGKPVFLSTAYDGCETRFSIDKNGNAVVVWTTKDKQKHGISAAYKLVGKPWSSPIQLATDLDQIQLPPMDTTTPVILLSSGAIFLKKDVPSKENVFLP